MKILNIKAFSIIEIMVWIFVFSLWITSVFAIISSTMQINDYNKNHIIASNLAREQIELIRNIRDSNYKKIQKYNQINPGSTDYNTVFETGNKYKIWNNYEDSSTFPIKVENITAWFQEWQENLIWAMSNYNLCLDSENRYTYDCEWWNIPTKFYKHISIDNVEYKKEDWTTQHVDDAFIVTSKVIWYIKWYHEFEVKSVIADWKRL